MGLTNYSSDIIIVWPLYSQASYCGTCYSFAGWRPYHSAGLEESPHSISDDVCLRFFANIYLDFPNLFSIKLDSGLRYR